MFSRLILIPLFAACIPLVQATEPVEITEEALRIHRSSILIDGHNDLPWQLRQKGESSFDVMDIEQVQPNVHTDIPRLKEGGVGAQFWAAYVPVGVIADGGAARFALEQIDLIHRMVERYPHAFEMALTADDIERITRSGKIASLIGIEGGHAIENSLGALRMFHELGVRYMTLTHSDSLDWADASNDVARNGGLSPFGEDVILEMNRLGMLVDISHVSAETMHDVLRITRAPVIASHSSAYAIAKHNRNVPDDVLKLVSENRGVIMVNFFSGFVEPKAADLMSNMFEITRALREQYPDDVQFRLARQQWRRDNPMPRGTVQTVVDHIDHIVSVGGIDIVGIGADYDGVTTLPEQLDDVSTYPYVTQELLNRGYSTEDIRKILGENVLRVMREAEDVAATWDASSPNG